MPFESLSACHLNWVTCPVSQHKCPQLTNVKNWQTCVIKRWNWQACRAGQDVWTTCDWQRQHFVRLLWDPQSLRFPSIAELSAQKILARDLMSGFCPISSLTSLVIIIIPISDWQRKVTLCQMGLSGGHLVWIIWDFSLSWYFRKVTFFCLSTCCRLLQTKAE